MVLMSKGNNGVIALRLSAIFSSVTQTQTRTQLARVWLEYKSSGIKLSMSGV